MNISHQTGLEVNNCPLAGNSGISISSQNFQENGQWPRVGERVEGRHANRRKYCIELYSLEQYCTVYSLVQYCTLYSLVQYCTLV